MSQRAKCLNTTKSKTIPVGKNVLIPPSPKISQWASSNATKSKNIPVGKHVLIPPYCILLLTNLKRPFSHWLSLIVQTLKMTIGVKTCSIYWCTFSWSKPKFLWQLKQHKVRFKCLHQATSNLVQITTAFSLKIRVITSFF